MSRTMEVGAQTRRNCPPRNEEQRKQHIEENKDKKETGSGANSIYCPCFLRRTSPAEGGDVFTKTRLVPVQVFGCSVLRCSGQELFGVQVFRCSGVQVFWSGVWCSGVQVFRVTDILEGRKGDRRGSPKMAKIQMG